MPPDQKTVPTWSTRYVVDTGLFFGLYLLYVRLVIDPRLIHHSIGLFMPALSFSFSIGWPFVLEHASQVGGLVDYASRWLTQFFAIGWIGALVVAAAACFLCIAVDALTRIAGRSRGMIARYVPATLLLVAWSRFSHPLPSVLTLLAALACFAIYLVAARRSATTGFVALVGLFVGVYYAAGAGALLFPALVVPYESLVKRRPLLAVSALVCALVVPWAVGMTFFHVSFHEAYLGFLVSASGVIGWGQPCVLALYLFFPIVLAVAALPIRGPGWWSSERCLSWAIQLAVVLLVVGAAAWFSLDRGGRVVLRMDYYAQQEEWSKVLVVADQMPAGQFSVRCNRNIMLAQYHTGRLGDEMFRYPQLPGIGLYSAPSSERGPDSYLQESQICLLLGQVNLAERWASEALECNGDLPAILKVLATINIVKDRPETARMFLTALSKKPLHRRWAREMLQQLNEDPRLASDPRCNELRQSMAQEDNVESLSPEVMLVSLHQRIPGDRKAFELLLAHYLHSCRPEKVVYWLQQPTSFHYETLPRHFQEAIVIYSIMAHGCLPQNDPRVSQEVIDRAVELDSILAEYGRGNPKTREAALAAGFGDSFLFYFNFRMSGV